MGEGEGGEQRNIFEQAFRLYLIVQGQQDASKICAVLKSDIAKVLKSDLLLFIRYASKAQKIDILASSDPRLGTAAHHSVDEASVQWITKQRGCKLAWFHDIDKAPTFLKDIGEEWRIKACAAYLGDFTDGYLDMIILGANDLQEDRWMKQDRGLLEMLMGGVLVLEIVNQIKEVGTIKTDIKTVFDLAPVGIMIVDSDATVLDMNNQALSILGGEFPIESIIGESVLTNSHLKGSGLDLLIQKALEGQEIENDNFKLKMGEGRVTHLHIKMRPVTKSDGEMMAIGVLSDVTQRVRMQQQLERSYRTITEAFQELQKVDNMKTKFIDVVSHELRTPLTVMRGYLELIEAEYKSTLDPKVLSKMNVMKINTDRMYDLVESMLDVAQIEKGAMEVSKQEVSITALVEEVVASQRSLSMEKRQELLIVTVGEISSTRIDVNRMRSALKNIVNNAIRYTPEGGKIQVGIADEGKMLHIWIKDSGIGIPTGDLEKIFDRFHIVTAEELSHQVDRIGLGLPITKGIIEGHGGKIWVESEVGKGSIFHINIPK